MRQFREPREAHVCSVQRSVSPRAEGRLCASEVWHQCNAEMIVGSRQQPTLATCWSMMSAP